MIATVDEINVTGKRVFVRVDFNVPFFPGGGISDDTRITAALPTIRHLCDAGARVILGSHLGRPKGERVPGLSLKPIAARLAELLLEPVIFLEEIVGPEVGRAIDAIRAGSIVLLENLRFHPGEECNTDDFVFFLSQLADVYINDAFGTAHRAHASIVGIPAKVKEKAAGLLMQRELRYLGEATRKPRRPFVVLLGGAKVSDKIGVIRALLKRADTILIGGAMAYTFARAKEQEIGNSLSEPHHLYTALRTMEEAERLGVRLLLPVDHMVAESVDFCAGTVSKVGAATHIPPGWSGVDIGPETIERYASLIASARTILWNGPMGIVEIESCRRGTVALAEVVSRNSEAVSIVGGGDSIKALHGSGQALGVSFISTGGGATLEFLKGKELPGVSALEID